MENERLLGVFTEREILTLTAAGTCLTSLIFRAAWSLFRQHHIRHLPIVDEEGKPIGIVTNDTRDRSASLLKV